MCGGFVGGITNAFEDVAGGIANLGQSAIDEAQRAGRTIDRTVRNEIPGGWTTAALMAAGAYYAPEIGAWVGSDGATLASAADVAASDAAAGAGGITDLIGSTDPLDYMNLGSGAGGDYGSGFGVGMDLGEGIAADYTAPDAGIDWTNPDNWDKAGLGDPGMGGAAPSGLSKFLQGAKDFLGKDTGIGGLTTGGALVGAAGLYKLLDMIKEDNKRFGTPGRQDYTGGALSKFKYDPGSFTPTRADPSKFRPQSNIPTLNQGEYRQPEPMPIDETGFMPRNPNPLQDVRQRIDSLGLDEKFKDARQRIDALNLDEKFKSSGIGRLLGRNRRSSEVEQMPQILDTADVKQPVSPVLQQINNQMLGSGLGGIDRLFGFAEGGKTKRPELTSKAKLAALDPYLRAIAEMNNAAYAARMPVGMQAPAGNLSQMGQYAAGGMSHLGDYSDGGRLLRGPGDGVSDSIPAMIGNKQPARLADGEFVVPARIVSELGNGSTDAGARKLYAMMDRVQSARGKTTGKGKVAKNTRADKYLPA